VCGDLLQDARFADQSWVGGEKGWRCFVSSPMLASNGHRLGTICFMDGAARTVSANDCRLLNNFAELAVRALERHVKLYERLDFARSAYAAGLARPEDELLVNAFAREQRREGAGDAC
jgi:GAF domain-containing protein